LIPIDLATSSASGLDPDISLASAEYQASRVAQARHLPAQQIQTFIQQHIQAPLFGFLGEARVNILQLNLALDSLPPSQNLNPNHQGTQLP